MTCSGAAADRQNAIPFVQCSFVKDAWLRHAPLRGFILDAALHYRARFFADLLPLRAAIVEEAVASRFGGAVCGSVMG